MLRDVYRPPEADVRRERALGGNGTDASIAASKHVGSRSAKVASRLEYSGERLHMKRIFGGALPMALMMAVVVVGCLAIRSRSAVAEGARPLPAPAIDLPPGPATSAVVVLAGGCFWGVQGVFSARQRRHQRRSPAMRAATRRRRTTKR